VGGVDLGCYPLGPLALFRVGEPVGMETLDQLPALFINLFYGGAGPKAEPVVGG
jgi:hypothetical protein